jgi:AAA domain
VEIRALQPLRGADVVIVADADTAGRKHAVDVARRLDDFCDSVRVLELPGAKDASDWIGGGGDASAFWQLVEARAVPWTDYKVAADQTAPDAKHLGTAAVLKSDTEQPQPDANGPAPAPAKIVPIAFTSAATWHEKAIPALRWTVRERILRGNVAILSGDGAIGKTTIALRLAAAVARAPIGSAP